MNLPPECIPLILIHLKADIKTLHSCLFVNRLWCSETVRILWHQPFRHLYTSDCQMEIRILQAENLILTYLSCIFYQYNEELVKNSVILTPVKKPLFNYIQFLKNLDLLDFFAVIQGCTESEHTHTFENYKLAISYILLDNSSSKPVGTLVNGFIGTDLLNIISKLIADHSTGLYRLSLDAEGSEGIKVVFKKNMIIKPKSYLYVMKLFDSKGHLSQLAELIMTTKVFNKAKILLALIPVSRNLKKIVVRVDYIINVRSFRYREYEEYLVKQDAKALSGLIAAQESLVHLGLHGCAEGLDILLASIESQANTLKYLSFVKVHFHGFDMFKHIAPLRNLEQIQFSYCTFDLKDASSPYRFENNFPKLVKLETQGSTNADYAVEILRSAACSSFNVECEPRNSIFNLEY
ncbi:7313_t:CDS:1, partial [Acaulospora morrowiae]